MDVHEGSENMWLEMEEASEEATLTITFSASRVTCRAACAIESDLCHLLRTNDAIKCLLVDFSGVRCIEPGFLVWLINLEKKARSAGKSLRICHGDAGIFSLTNLGKRFEIVDIPSHRLALTSESHAN
jgi:hypothetical protein